MSAIFWAPVIVASIAAALYALAVVVSRPVYRYQDGQCGESI